MATENQIEELAMFLRHDGRDCVSTSCLLCNISRHCIERRLAEAVIFKGYSKASEVAREIFEEIESCVWSETQYGDSKLCFEINSAKYAELKKKYTEEH